MATKIPLEIISVASPCSVPWDAMSGDDRTRFCGQCSQFVYNLSDLTKADAESLIMEHDGKMCGRFFRRIDGTIMTSDCPVGWRGVKHRLVIATSVTGAAIVAILSFVLFSVLGGGDGANRRGGARFPNPIHVIRDMFFPPAIAGEICPVPAVPPAGGGPTPQPDAKK